MSRSKGGHNPSKKAVALQYGPGDPAPVIVASGMGYMAERMIEVAAESGVPIYEDNSLATVLTQLELGRPIPEELYQAIVEIYVYFLRFDPKTGKARPVETQSALPDQGEGAGPPPEPPSPPEHESAQEEAAT